MDANSGELNSSGQSVNKISPSAKDLAEIKAILSAKATERAKKAEAKKQEAERSKQESEERLDTQKQFTSNAQNDMATNPLFLSVGMNLELLSTAIGFDASEISLNDSKTDLKAKKAFENVKSFYLFDLLHPEDIDSIEDPKLQERLIKVREKVAKNLLKIENNNSDDHTGDIRILVALQRDPELQSFLKDRPQLLAKFKLVTKALEDYAHSKAEDVKKTKPSQVKIYESFEKQERLLSFDIDVERLSQMKGLPSSTEKYQVLIETLEDGYKVCVGGANGSCMFAENLDELKAKYQELVKDIKEKDGINGAKLSQDLRKALESSELGRELLGREDKKLERAIPGVNAQAKTVHTYELAIENKVAKMISSEKIKALSTQDKMKYLVESYNELGLLSDKELKMALLDSSGKYTALAEKFFAKDFLDSNGLNKNYAEFGSARDPLSMSAQDYLSKSTWDYAELEVDKLYTSYEPEIDQVKKTNQEERSHDQIADKYGVPESVDIDSVRDLQKALKEHGVSLLAIYHETGDRSWIVDQIRKEISFPVDFPISSFGMVIDAILSGENPKAVIAKIMSTVKIKKLALGKQKEFKDLLSKVKTSITYDTNYISKNIL